MILQYFQCTLHPAAAVVAAVDSARRGRQFERQSERG